MTKHTSRAPLEWAQNQHSETPQDCPALDRLKPQSSTRVARQFHSQLDGYRMSSLKSLAHLAALLGLGGIWVKDESERLDLNAFKVLGGSFAIYQFLRKRLGVHDRELSVAELKSEGVRSRLGDICFAAATDGNHGRGVAWAAQELGFGCVIYVHERTSIARIRAIEEFGARVEIIPGTYDDAVRQVAQDAEANGWQIIADTAAEGDDEVPNWVMQGYTTMFAEAQEQLIARDIPQPTHVLVQAGVGSLAASVIGYYEQLLHDKRPVTVVVEPDQSACLFESAKKADHQPHAVDGTLDTIMAGLACGIPNPLAWDILDQHADFFLSCPDFIAAKGMRVYAAPLGDDPIVVSGESGAVTLGALMFIAKHPSLVALKEKMKLDSNSHVLLINTEGDTDPEHYRQVVWEGRHPVPEEFRDQRE